MNHLMMPPSPSIHMDILIQMPEQKALEEHSVHTFILTPSWFLLMNSWMIFYVPHFLFLA